MSIYKRIGDIGSRFIPRHILFKYGFNLAPMYRRSTGHVTYVSEDLRLIRVRIPLSYKNRNFVNTMFGGSMFSSVDPFPMVQLINLIGDDYMVWDKSAEIKFRRPGNQSLYAEFTYSDEELDKIKTRVKEEKEIEFQKVTLLTDKAGDKVFCEVIKNLYIADKKFYKQKKSLKK